MPQTDPDAGSGGPSAKLQVALGLGDDRAAYKIFAGSIRKMCMSKLDITILPSHISERMMEPIFEEAQREYPKLLSTLSNGNSGVKMALVDYIRAQQDAHRCSISKVKRMISEECAQSKPDVNVQITEKQHSDETQKRVPVETRLEPPGSAQKNQRNPSQSTVMSVLIGEKRKAIYIEDMEPDVQGQKRYAIKPEPSSTISSSSFEVYSPPTNPFALSGSSSSKRTSQDKGIKSEVFDGSLQRPTVKKEPEDRIINSVASKEKGMIDLAAIDDFLEAATPPMDKFLPHFLDAGLHTEEDLRMIAKWDEEEIVNFFLTSSRQFDTKMTTIDIFRLKKHIKTYFPTGRE